MRAAVNFHLDSISPRDQPPVWEVQCGGESGLFRPRVENSRVVILMLSLVRASPAVAGGGAADTGG